MYKLSVIKMTELDNFKEGCNGNLTDHGEIDSTMRNTLPEILEYIKFFYGEPYIYDDRLEFQQTENGKGYKANHQELEDWEDARIKLYAANYSFYITEVVLTKLDHKTLKQAFASLKVEL